MDPISVLMFASSMADAKASREAAKDQGRRSELGREYASQMRGQRDKRTVTDYNQAARDAEISRIAAERAEESRSYQAGEAAGFIKPRAELGLGGIAAGMKGRDMAGVGGMAETNPLTGGSAWANALTDQKRDLMADADDMGEWMSMVQAGERRAVGDQEVLGQVAATQAGEAPRIGAEQQDASIAKSDVGQRARKRKMDIAKREQHIDKVYEPWITGSSDVAVGSMTDALKGAREAGIGDIFKSKAPPTSVSLKPGGYGGGGFGARGGAAGDSGFGKGRARTVYEV